MTGAAAKIVSRGALCRWRAGLAAKGVKVVFTNGCFDILHKGHAVLLEKARRLGGALVVGLNSDDSVRRLKGPSRPLNSEADRAFVLASLSAVDRVCVFGEDTPYELLSELRPDVLAKGGDYRPSEIVGREFAGKTVRVPLVKGRSTTGLVSKIAGKDRPGSGVRCC